MKAVHRGISPSCCREIRVNLAADQKALRNAAMYSARQTGRRGEKVAKALASGFTALLCIGETARNRPTASATGSCAPSEDRPSSHHPGAGRQPLDLQARLGHRRKRRPGRRATADERHRVIRTRPVGALRPRNRRRTSRCLRRQHEPGKATPAFNSDAPRRRPVYRRSAWDADRFNAIIRTVLPLFGSRKNAASPCPTAQI